MKKILFLLVFVLFIINLYGQENIQRPATNRGNYSRAYGQTVTWHKRVVTGTDTKYTRGTTDGYLYGASDSLYSDIFYNNGRNNVVVDIVADATSTTVSVQAKVLSANSGDYAAKDIPEAMFSTAYWLVKGTGAAANIVSTSQDSITSAGKTGTIQIPLLDAEWYKFLFITSTVHTDTNVVNIYLNRQER